jgi:hypothetical protein
MTTLQPATMIRVVEMDDPNLILIVEALIRGP